MKALVTIFLLVSTFLFSNVLKAQCDTINHWESIVLAENNWKYYSGLIDPGNSWHTSAYNDQTWNEGPGGFGYGDDDDGTVIGPTITVYLRKTFTINNLSEIQQALLHLDYDDGFVAYLNGVEFARENMGASGSPTNNLQGASGLNEANLPNGGIPPVFTIDLSLLQQGSNVLAIEVHNEGLTSSDLSSNAWLSVGITSPTQQYFNTPTWFVKPIAFYQSHLPLVIIETSNQTIVDEPSITVNMKIVNTGNTNLVCGPYEYDGNIAIEIRGNSSQEYPKKQYTIETRDEFGENLNVSLLGMPEENDWVLYAPYSDKTLMRNVVAYQLGSQMFEYAPRTRFCEVVINGEYLGIYVLTEKVKRDDNRVNINKLSDDEISGDKLTGGYIIVKDRTPDDYEGGFLSSYPASNGFGELFYSYVYPTAGDIVTEQEDYIEDVVGNFEDALKSNEFSDPNMGYRPHIDMQSFVNYYIIEELSKDIDAYRLSTYFYKDKESLGGALKMGPVWDFNIAFGNSFACGAVYTNGSVLSMSDSCGVQFPFWWQRLPEDEFFMQNVVCNWNNYRQSFLSNQSIINTIDEQVAKLGPAVNRNFERWPVLDQYVWPNPIIHNSYANEISFYKQWILDRMSYLDQVFAGNCELTSISEQNSVGNWRVGPNPFSEDALVSGYLENDNNIIVSVYNQMGQVIATKRIQVVAGNVTFTVKQIVGTELSKGLYHLTISNTEGVQQNLRLIKQ